MLQKIQYLVVASVSVNLGELLSDRERREATLPDNFLCFHILNNLQRRLSSSLGVGHDITCEKDTPLDTHVHAYLLDPGPRREHVGPQNTHPVSTACASLKGLACRCAHRRVTCTDFEQARRARNENTTLDTPSYSETPTRVQAKNQGDVRVIWNRESYSRHVHARRKRHRNFYGEY